MIQILVNENFFLEKKYIIEVLLEEFLCFYDYQISISTEDNYVFINQENNKKIEFIDSFFKKQKEPYLKQENLPKKPIHFKYEDVEYYFPFGNPKILETTDEITCEIDLFSSSYFFLSRWEEYVIKEKDKHNRFIDENSWLIKNNLQNRPLVNEYANLLSILLIKIDIYPNNKHKFTPIITHDVDLIARYDTGKKIIKAFGGDLLLRKSASSFIKTIKDVIGICFFKLNDPYNTFDYLMNLSESVNVKSRFYFIAGKKNEFDVRYNYDEKKAIRIYNKIQKRGHIIGIHPSYNSFLNCEQLKKEKERLEKITNITVKEVRHHFLRINLPESWEILEKVGLKEDSSVGFSKHNGFRTGTCYKYTVFDFLNREKLSLKENPLLVMEVSSVYFDNEPNKMIIEIEKIIKEVKKYNGNFTFLWHNNSFFTKEHFKTYETIIKLLN